MRARPSIPFHDLRGQSCKTVTVSRRSSVGALGFVTADPNLPAITSMSNTIHLRCPQHDSGAFRDGGNIEQRREKDAL